MKRLFSAVLLLSILFASCTFLLSDSSDKSSEKKVRVYISLSGNEARSALPDVTWSDEWKNLTYKLIAVQNPNEVNQKNPVTLFENCSYDNLGQGIELDVAKYRFTLEAYKGGVKSLSGETTVNLAEGNTVLSFKMYPATGSTGSAVINLTYPSDGVVSSVKAGVSSTIFASPESVHAETVRTKISSGVITATISKENLPSNTEQYLLLWFYDANGSLIYSGAESLIIFGGYTSYANINLTKDDWHSYICTVSLKKDGEAWVGSGKKVTLVDSSKTDKKYELRDVSGGNFEASVADGKYFIYVDDENTGLEFYSVDKTEDVNYYTVKLGAANETVKNCSMTIVEGGLPSEENSSVVLRGSDFKYKLSLSRGYEVETALTVKENGSAVSGADFEKTLTISDVKNSVNIIAEGITPIVYTITYKDNGTSLAPSKVENDAYWYAYQSTYNPPVEFTAEDVVVLPTMQNVRKDNNFFDAWVDSHGNVINDTDGIFENLVLSSTWKDAPFVYTYKDLENNIDLKIIYANGFNLLIKGSDAKNTKTYVYVDYNADGIVNDDDYQISGTNLTDKADFTGYELRAGNKDGKEIKSDFTFNIQGGKLSSIYGLNSRDYKLPNKSTVNISGNAEIGSFNPPVNGQGPESEFLYSDNVTGVMLETLSDERVYITGQMGVNGGKYSVTCVTPYLYDANQDHVVAYINNSTYASLSYFTCWTVQDTDRYGNSIDPRYRKDLLAHKKEIKNGITHTVIRMADDCGIELPEKEVRLEDFVDEFSLGSSTVSINCSVFSVAVENGSFRVNERTTITENTSDSDKAVERTLTYMAQPDPYTYDESFAFNKSYVYMQIMSSGNQLTPEIASKFLSQVYFKQDDVNVPLKVTVNLETVPSEEIAAAKVNYFNGSFYKCYYETDAAGNLPKWTDAYNKAKAELFNGLHGYLMTVTSEVENNYIFTKSSEVYPDKLFWMGGARYINKAGTYDTPTFTGNGNTTAWYWQCGPEAGQMYYSQTTALSTQAATDEWQAKNPGKLDPGMYNDKGEYMYSKWNNHFIYPEIVRQNEGVNVDWAGNSKEPNNSGTENCCQFLSGILGNKYRANGYWNDQAYSTQTGGYAAGYIVEFTPYTNAYNTETANYQAIKRTATYSLGGAE
ncbi:MAG: hypothetical protein MJ179_04040 [Treponema sp.]|nr:hypothetical protein [Treponema sp.]